MYNVSIQLTSQACAVKLEFVSDKPTEPTEQTCKLTDQKLTGRLTKTPKKSERKTK